MATSHTTPLNTRVTATRIGERRVQDARIMLGHAVIASLAILAVAASFLVAIP